MTDGRMKPEQRDQLHGWMDEQAELLFILADAVYEGHIIGLVANAVIVFVRPFGTREPREERRWHIDDIDDVGPANYELVEEPEDPLAAHARALAQRALQTPEQTLAERLAEERLREGWR